MNNIKQQPRFLLCSSYTNDNFWKQIFSDLSRGKLPRGIQMNDEYISCGYKNKEFNYYYKDKTASQITIDIHKH